MFIKMNPQPGVGDISQRVIKRYGYKGVGIADNENGDGFIAFPGDDATGVKIINRNGSWYWAKPLFTNLTMPVDHVKDVLEPFKELFTGR